MQESTIVIIGAGAVGRGFIGDLFSAASWEVRFLDVNAGVVEALRREGGYRLRTVGAGGGSRWVSPVTAGYLTDEPLVTEWVASARVLATCVGAANLPAVADALRSPLLERFGAGGDPVDLLLCENLHGASAVMRDLLGTGLDGAERALLADSLGLVETSIGRMIPSPGPGSPEGPTGVAVEAYRFLPVDAAASRGPVLDVPGLVVDEMTPFGYYADRKLHLHNMGHYFCGLLGQLLGIDDLWRAAQTTSVHAFARAAMVESAVALASRYGRPVAPLLDHVDDLLHRFTNPELGDPVARVVRDPVRKLARDDRLLGAYAAAIGALTPSRHLSLAVAAGVLALQRELGWTPPDGESFLTAEVAAAGGTPAQQALALAQLRSLAAGFDAGAQQALIGRTFDPPAIP